MQKENYGDEVNDERSENMTRKEKKIDRLAIRLTIEEHDQLRRIARREQVSVSEIVRQRLHPALNQEAGK